MWQRIVAFVLGEGPKGTPPERVRWLIVEQQVKSEILIGWVGFALVVRGREAPTRIYSVA